MQHAKPVVVEALIEGVAAHAAADQLPPVVTDQVGLGGAAIGHAQRGADDEGHVPGRQADRQGLPVHREYPPVGPEEQVVEPVVGVDERVPVWPSREEVAEHGAYLREGLVVGR